jgi:hypothetical protein
VEKAPTACVQSIPARAICVTASHAQVELLRRLRALSRVDLDRVPVECADLSINDLIARTVALFDRFCDVFNLDVLVEAIA